MNMLNLESGGDYYYLLTQETKFYDPHGTADDGGVDKRVIKTKFKLPALALDIPLALEEYTDDFTMDALIHLIITGNEQYIEESIKDYKEDLMVIDNYTEEELDKLDILDILNDLPMWDDSDTYAENGYNYTVTFTSIRELKDEAEADTITAIINAYESL